MLGCSVWGLGQSQCGHWTISGWSHSRQHPLAGLGEEIFFGGLIASVAVPRFGFARGNAIQALVFLAPHLLLLAVDPALWPILPVQLVSGWLMGWLLHRSGSVGPPALAHVTINIAFGLSPDASIAIEFGTLGGAVPELAQQPPPETHEFWRSEVLTIGGFVQHHFCYISIPFKCKQEVVQLRGAGDTGRDQLNVRI